MKKVCILLEIRVKTIQFTRNLSLCENVIRFLLIFIFHYDTIIFVDKLENQMV